MATDWEKLDKEFNPPPKSTGHYFGLWLGEWLALKGIPLAIGTVIATAAAFGTWKACALVWAALFG